MKVVLLASKGGSGGLKGYIKGFISACETKPDWEWFVICDETLADYIKPSVPSNVRIILNGYTMGVKAVIRGNRLPQDVINIINEIQPDVVFHMNSIIHKGVEQYKNIVGFHNQLYVDKRQLRRQRLGKTRVSLSLLRPYAIRSMKDADLVVFDSHNSLDATKACGIVPKNSVVAYFGVEKSERKQEWTEKTLSNTAALLYVSTLYPYKNQVELLRGIHELKQMGCDVHLHLVGSGPKAYEKRVRRQIIKHSLDSLVTIHNWVPHQEIKDMIESCDVFVYASSIETSGFGLMEGMVQGAVIACNQESCMPEILNGGGVIFDVSSPKDVAEKIKYLIENPEARNELSKRAFEVSKEYTWENCVQTITDAIEALQ